MKSMENSLEKEKNRKEKNNRYYHFDQKRKWRKIMGEKIGSRLTRYRLLDWWCYNQRSVSIA